MILSSFCSAAALEFAVCFCKSALTLLGQKMSPCATYGDVDTSLQHNFREAFTCAGGMP